MPSDAVGIAAHFTAPVQVDKVVNNVCTNEERDLLHCATSVSWNRFDVRRYNSMYYVRPPTVDRGAMQLIAHSGFLSFRHLYMSRHRTRAFK